MAGVVAGQQRASHVVLRPGGQVRVMVKGRVEVGLRGGQRDPQLRCVQHGCLGQRVFGVGDAVPGRHQVDLAGAHDLFAAQAVAVQDLPLDHPGEGLQARVRVRPDMQAGAFLHIDRPNVVEKAPGAHPAPVPRGQGPANRQALAQLGGAQGDALEGGFGGGWGGCHGGYLFRSGDVDALWAPVASSGLFRATR